ncbi:MAG: YbhB/YbcL family Raf kinase inhibitor-like protein [Methanobacterium sp.]
MALNLGDLQIHSPAFDPLEHIPERYVYDGDNISPPVEWSGVPPDTKEFALICHDPDAPLPYGFTHWVVYGIPADITGIAEGEGKKAFTEGTTGYGEQGWGGPAPPPGHGPHHYYFWLYALDKVLNLKPGLTREQLLDAIADHVTVQARLVGIYEL